MPASNLLEEDILARARAIDVRSSFLVQAPAGSGKTELLTQRFLALLGQSVDTPETVLAITFTNKAAAEMRHRVVASLRRASDTSEPESEPDRTNWRLAKAVLKRDAQLQWDILHNPGRLRIMTIDALCGAIAQQLPLLSEFGTQPNITDSPDRIYEQAARQALDYWAKQAPHQTDGRLQLLLRVDNRLDRLITMLMQMLAVRDQWLPQVARHRVDTRESDSHTLSHVIDTTLQHIIEDQLTQLGESLSDAYPNFFTELRTWLQHVRSGFEVQELTHSELERFPLVALLERWDVACKAVAAGQLPPVSQQLAFWRLASGLLTTGKPGKKQFRKPKGIKKDQGFPTTVVGLDKNELARLKSIKAQFQQWLSDLCENDALLLACESIDQLPDLGQCPMDAMVLDQLNQLLLLAVGFLKVTFQTHGQVDFCEVSLGALRALSDTQESQAAIDLNEQYAHILVDEFQDTSLTQFHLLRQLIGEWQVEDVPADIQPPTLFLVGDPMQSIYRFRQAQVGLFLQVKSEGIGPVRPQFLRLTQNFRSDPAVIDWINAHFNHIFPKQHSITQGRVAYSSALAGRSACEHSMDTGVCLSWQKDEVALVTDCIQRIEHIRMNDPDASMALLVRGRSQLRHLLPALTQARIPFEAIEARSILGDPLVEDLLSLTSVIVDPMDDLAWAAVLRSPICGLDLNDLLTVFSVLGDDSQSSQSFHSLWSVFESWNTCDSKGKLGQPFARISESGQLKMSRILTPLRKVIGVKPYVSIVKKVRWAAWALGLEACVTEENAQSAASFWQLIEKHLPFGQATVLSELKLALAKVQASLLTQDPNPLQIMTIHKSKGLEFDYVFIPFAEKAGRRDDDTLLRAQPVVLSRGDGVLMAPLPSRTTNNEPNLYEYLRYLESQKSLQELKRLFYVAVTRGKRQVCILSCVSGQGDGASVKSAREDTFLASLQESLTQDEKARLIDSLSVDGVEEPSAYKEPSACKNKEPSAYKEPSACKNKETLAGNHSQSVASESPTVESSYAGDASITFFCEHSPLPWAQVLAAGFSSRSFESQAETDTSFLTNSPESIQAILDAALPRAVDVERICGTALHEVLEAFPTLQRLRRFVCGTWQDTLASTLQAEGLDPQETSSALKRLKACFEHLIETERGQWIMKERSTQCVEWSLIQVVDNQSQQLRLDRLFIENGCLWIVDYKLSFLVHQDDERVIAHYGDQLFGYQRAIQNLSAHKGALAFNQPFKESFHQIRCALYFPEHNRWVELPAEAISNGLLSDAPKPLRTDL